MARTRQLVGPSGGVGGPPTADAASLALENARLHREQETVSRQRDILKKSLGHFGARTRDTPHRPRDLLAYAWSSPRAWHGFTGKTS